MQKNMSEERSNPPELLYYDGLVGDLFTQWKRLGILMDQAACGHALAADVNPALLPEKRARAMSRILRSIDRLQEECNLIPTSASLLRAEWEVKVMQHRMSADYGATQGFVPELLQWQQSSVIAMMFQKWKELQLDVLPLTFDSSSSHTLEMGYYSKVDAFIDYMNRWTKETRLDDFDRWVAQFLVRWAQKMNEGKPIRIAEVEPKIQTVQQRVDCSPAHSYFPVPPTQSTLSSPFPVKHPSMDHPTRLLLELPNSTSLLGNTTNGTATANVKVEDVPTPSAVVPRAQVAPSGGSCSIM